MIATGDKLILCAGPGKQDGFQTLDANPAFSPDYCVELPPFPRELRTGRWWEIYLIHGIEHFYLWEAEELVPQLYEALAPGGMLVMEQPNLGVIMKVALGLMSPMTPDAEASGIKAIYGDPKYGNPFMAHKWGWTPETLTALAVRSGFAADHIRIATEDGLSRPFAKGRDFRLAATK